MKKGLVYFLWIVLLFFTLPVNAEKVGLCNPEDVFTTEQIASLYGKTSIGIKQVTEHQGKVYAYLTNSCICCWEPEENRLGHVCKLPQSPSGIFDSYRDFSEDEKKKWDDIVTCLFTKDSGIYGINCLNGKVGLINENGIEWGTKKLDISCLFPDDRAWPARIVSAFSADCNLYLFIALDDDDYPHNHYQLLCFDLNTGKCRSIEIKDAQGLCRADIDSVYLLCYEADKWVIKLLDLHDYVITDTDFDVRASEYDRPIGGIAYDNKAQLLYYASEGKVFSVKEKESPCPFATLPVSDVVGESYAFILPDSRYAFFDYKLIIRQQQEIDINRTLHLGGCMDDTILQSFAKENPDVSVVFDESLNSPDEIITRLLTGDSSADLYHTCVDNTFVTLVDKGYAMDLSESRLITDDVNRMYPNIRKAIVNEAGNPVAYPYILMTDNWMVNITWWRAVFGDKELPETYEDFFRDMILWEEEYAEYYPEIGFAGAFDFSSWVKQVINAYEQQYSTFIGKENVSADLKDTRLTDVLDLIEQIRDLYEQGKRNTFGEEIIDSIFIPDGFNSIFQEPWKDEMLSMTVDQLPEGIYIDMPMLTFERGVTVPVAGQLYVWFVNPFSENKDLALRYLEHAAMCNNNLKTYYGTHPDMNEPVPNKKWTERYHELTERQEQLQALRSEQNEINEELAQNIKENEAALQRAERWMWDISPKSIEHYREYAGTIAFFEDNPFVMRLGRNSNIATAIDPLYEQYEAGILNREEFLNQYQSRINMILAERK